MNEVEVYKQTLNRQAQRIASLALDLDLALAQIDLLNKQLEEKNKDSEEETK